MYEYIQQENPCGSVSGALRCYSSSAVSRATPPPPPALAKQQSAISLINDAKISSSVHTRMYVYNASTYATACQGQRYW